MLTKAGHLNILMRHWTVSAGTSGSSNGHLSCFILPGLSFSQGNLCGLSVAACSKKSILHDSRRLAAATCVGMRGGCRQAAMHKPALCHHLQPGSPEAYAQTRMQPLGNRLVGECTMDA